MGGKKSSRGLLIILSGLPGAGKSTLAKMIKSNLRERRVVILEGDFIRKQMFPVQTYSLEETRKVRLAIMKETVENLQKGDIVIYDATNIQEQSREAGRQAARQTGCPYIVVQVVADESLVRERLLSKGDNGQCYSDATYCVYEELKQLVEPIMGEFITVSSEDYFAQDFTNLMRYIRAQIQISN